jgi:disulfide bond formation protein DsbB
LMGFLFCCKMKISMKDFIIRYSLYIAWALALLGLVVSLYFSNVLKFPPCVLCWYQRICLYPLVFILGIGILRKDRNVFYYAIPLSIVGLIIAIYHNLLYIHVIPEALAPCVTGISCTTQFVEYFGFVSIPFLSLIAFIAIIICLIVFKKGNTDVERT